MTDTPAFTKGPGNLIERLREKAPFLNEDDMWLHLRAADALHAQAQRIEELEGYLRGALNVVEGFTVVDTAQARAALSKAGASHD